MSPGYASSSILTSAAHGWESPHGRQQLRAALIEWLQPLLPYFDYLYSEGWAARDLIALFNGAAQQAGFHSPSGVIRNAPCLMRERTKVPEPPNTDLLNSLRNTLISAGAKRKPTFFLSQHAADMASELERRVRRGETRQAICSDFARRYSGLYGEPIAERLIYQIVTNQRANAYQIRRSLRAAEAPTAAPDWSAAAGSPSLRPVPIDTTFVAPFSIDARPSKDGACAESDDRSGRRAPVEPGLPDDPSPGAPAPQPAAVSAGFLDLARFQPPPPPPARDPALDEIRAAIDRELDHDPSIVRGERKARDF